MGPWIERASVSNLWRGRTRNEMEWQALKVERIENRRLCEEWRDAAVADGWSIEATYSHEPQEHAFRLKRDGFVISGLARPMPDDDKSLPVPTISIWGPDGAAVEPPLIYNWGAIKAGVEKCGECKRYPVKTGRYAFANRVCADCAEKFMASLGPNWAE